MFKNSFILKSNSADIYGSFRLFKKLEKMEIQNGGFLYQLYRNSCKYDGQYKKELKILGRNYQNVSSNFC